MSDTTERSAPSEPNIEIRGPKGRFVKGNPGPPEHAKRKKGVPNKVNRTVKDAMLLAAERIGSDGGGKGGVDGFLEATGRRNPEFLAAGIIRSCVPPAKEAELNPAAGGTITVNVISVPPNHFKCPDGNFRPDPEARVLWDEYNAKLKSEGAPLLIGHSPPPLEQGTVELEQQPQTIEPASPVEPVIEVLKPLSERDRIMARAKAMGYEPLPPRPHRNDW